MLGLIGGVCGRIVYVVGIGVVQILLVSVSIYRTSNVVRLLAVVEVLNGSRSGAGSPHAALLFGGGDGSRNES